MSGIVPILGRIAEIEARFAAGPPVPPGRAGVRRPGADGANGVRPDAFERVMIAAEVSLDDRILDGNGGVPPGLQVLSPTGDTPWIVPRGPDPHDPSHDHSHDDPHRATATAGAWADRDDRTDTR